jgi:nucleoside-diphosphate-sugar epimerase
LRILVTGASGYLGRSMVRRLARDHDVYSVVRQPGGEVPWPNVLTADLTRPQEIGRGWPAVDAVVHAAQSRLYRQFPDAAADVVSINVAATASLLDYAKSVGAGLFCLISSGTVYEPYTRGTKEDTPLAPTSINGATKLAAESLSRAYESLFDVQALRVFFPYGPLQRDRLIPDIVRRVLSGQQITLDGSEGLRLSPLFHEDLAEVVAVALERKWRGPVNVAGTEPVTLKELADIIGRLAGTTPVYRPSGNPALDLAADLARLRSLMDCSHFTPLEAGLGRVVAAHGGY